VKWDREDQEIPCDCRRHEQWMAIWSVQYVWRDMLNKYQRSTCKKIGSTKSKLLSSSPFPFEVSRSYDEGELKYFKWIPAQISWRSYSPTPKKRGVIKIDVIGENLCRSSGNMQARNVNSSDSGATMWFLIHKRFWQWLNQNIGSTRKIKRINNETFPMNKESNLNKFSKSHSWVERWVDQERESSSATKE